MRKPSTRLIALASATTISVTGLALASNTATADDEPRPWPVVQHGTASYTLDGFTVEYLPSGLEKHGLNAKSATDRRGGRTSEITWLTGPDNVHGRISVIRDDSITTLDQLRDAYYGHLDDNQLAEVDNKGRDTFLAEGTGDMFWIEEPGIAVTTYLAPDTWDADELARMAAGIEQHEQRTAEEHERTRTAQDPGDDRVTAQPESEAPESPGEEGASAQENTDLPTDTPTVGIRECLTEQMTGTRQGAEEGPRDSLTLSNDEPLGEEWRDSDQAVREDATRECAERFDVEDSVIEEVIEATERGSTNDSRAEEPGNEPDPLATVRDALAWTLPSVPLNG